MAKLDVAQLAKVLERPNLAIAILIPAHPTFDVVAAALGLRLALERANHRPVVACSTPMTVEFHRLVGANNVSLDFGNRNLIISFPGQTESVDKVSYNVEAGELQLVITPKSGAILDHTKLKFVPATIAADLVVLVGVKDLADLGKIYTDGRDIVDGVDQFWLDSPINSQAATQLVQQLHLPVDTDGTSNLLAGLEAATNHYQSPTVTAATFEAVAWLLRQGARRQQAAAPTDYPAGSVPTPTTVSPGQLPIDQQPEPEPDWYAPKIYRGTSLS